MFVKIGNLWINLDNVTEVVMYESETGERWATVSFVGRNAEKLTEQLAAELAVILDDIAAVATLSQEKD